MFVVLQMYFSYFPNLCKLYIETKRMFANQKLSKFSNTIIGKNTINNVYV